MKKEIFSALLISSVLIIIGYYANFLTKISFAVWNSWNNCQPTCKSGEVCQFIGARWQCVSGARCSSNADCAIGYVCFNGRCTNPDTPGIPPTSTSSTTSTSPNNTNLVNDWQVLCGKGEEPPNNWNQIPIDEVRNFYGENIFNNIRNLACSGVNPRLIGLLDRWTGEIHFEYKLPGGPTGNQNTWVYDLATGQVYWVGPAPMPFSPEEALRRIRNYMQNSGISTSTEGFENNEDGEDETIITNFEEQFRQLLINFISLLINQIGSSTINFSSGTPQVFVNFLRNLISYLQNNRLIFPTFFISPITTTSITTTPITTTSPPSITTPSPIATTTPTFTLASQSFTEPFRFLKIETTKQGWISWREIEAYDENGNKVIPVSVNALNGGWQPLNSGPEKAIDGNLHTAWNSGETNPSCYPNYGPNCPESTRQAWFIIDYGSPKRIVKIRLLPNGDAYTQTDKYYISNDNLSYKYINEFSGIVRDNRWIEFPFPTTDIPRPTVNLTVNGRKEVEIRPGEMVFFEWSSTNAFGMFGSYSVRFDSSLPGTTLNNRTTTCVYYAFSGFDPFGINRHPYRSFQGFIPLQTVNEFKMNPIILNSLLQRLGQAVYYECHPKSVFTFTLRAVSQYDPNKFAEDRVVVKVRGLPTNSWGRLINFESNKRVAWVKPGGVATTTIMFFDSSYQPRINVLSVPQGVNVSIGPWRLEEVPPNVSYVRVPQKALSDITINVGENVRPGLYIIKFQAEPELVSDFALLVVED